MSLCAQINEGRDVTYSPTGQGKSPDWRSGKLGWGEPAVRAPTWYRGTQSSLRHWLQAELKGTGMALPQASL